MYQKHLKTSLNKMHTSRMRTNRCGGLSRRGSLSGGGLCLDEGLCPEGVSVQRGLPRGSPSPVDRMTHASENIIFPCGR